MTAIEVEYELDTPPLSEENPFSTSLTITGRTVRPDRFAPDEGTITGDPKEIVLRVKNYTQAQSSHDIFVRFTFRQQSGISTRPPNTIAKCQLTLETIYVLAEIDRREASAEVMDHIDNLLLDEQFTTCDLCLKLVDVERLKSHPTVLVAFLGITAAAPPEKLPSRAILFARIKTVLTRELGPERAASILDRFR